MTSNTILVPLDGSAFGEAAVPVALGLARSLDLGIEFVSVFEDEPVVATWQVSAVEMRSLLIDYLKAISDRVAADSDVPIKSTVLGGSVTGTLEAHVSAKSPALVVMATHGRGPVSRAWLGSVADHVTRHVSMPVLLVRPENGEKVELTDAHQFRHILIPLDGSDRAENALPWATRIASGTGAAMTLMRVVSPPASLTSPYLPHAIQDVQEALRSGQREASDYLLGVAARLVREGLPKPKDVVAVGVAAASAIIRQAEESGVDLITITTHGRGGLPRLVLGSVADKVVRGAHAAVLVNRTR